jgi:SnoaL-like domain
MPTLEEMAADLAALRRRVDASEGVLELQALKARYGELVDQRYAFGRVVDRATLERIADSVAALFTPDGSWDGGSVLGTAKGRLAIASRLLSPTLSFSRHLFVKPQIRVDGDSAWARWDLLCPCSRPDGTSYFMCGFEDDEYVRTDGVWLHRSMKLTTLFMAPVAEGWAKILG